MGLAVPWKVCSAAADLTRRPLCLSGPRCQGLLGRHREPWVTEAKQSPAEIVLSQGLIGPVGGGGWRSELW